MKFVWFLNNLIVVLFFQRLQILKGFNLPKFKQVFHQQEAKMMVSLRKFPKMRTFHKLFSTKEYQNIEEKRLILLSDSFPFAEENPMAVMESVGHHIQTRIENLKQFQKNVQRIEVFLSDKNPANPGSRFFETQILVTNADRFYQYIPSDVTTHLLIHPNSQAISTGDPRLVLHSEIDHYLYQRIIPTGSNSFEFNGLYVEKRTINIPKAKLNEFLVAFAKYSKKSQKEIGLYRLELYQNLDGPGSKGEDYISFQLASVFNSPLFQLKHFQTNSFKEFSSFLIETEKKLPATDLNSQFQTYQSIFPSPIFFQSSTRIAGLSESTTLDTSVYSTDFRGFHSDLSLSTDAPSFNFQSPKIVMGRGILSQALPSILKSLKCTRPLLVMGKSGVKRYESILNGTALASLLPSDNIYVLEQEPTVEDARKAQEFAISRGVDVIIALGGGSVMDLGKAVSALIPNADHDIMDFLEIVGKGLPINNKPLPFIAIPTTSGTGSEVTKNAVLKSTEHHRKVSIRHDSMLPTLAIIDPSLTMSCPSILTAHVGMDTLCQVIEPYLCCTPNPFVDVFAKEGIIRAARSIRAAVLHGDSDIIAREDMAIASVFSGISLANARLGLVHGFAAVLGGMYDDAPHGAICARLLPFIYEKNYQKIQKSFDILNSEKEEEVNSSQFKTLTQEQREQHRQFYLQKLLRYREIAGWLTNNPLATIQDSIDWLYCLLTDIEIPSLSQLCPEMKEEHFTEIITATQQASSTKGNPVSYTDDELLEILKKAF